MASSHESVFVFLISIEQFLIPNIKSNNADKSYTIWMILFHTFMFIIQIDSKLHINISGTDSRGKNKKRPSYRQMFENT